METFLWILGILIAGLVFWVWRMRQREEPSTSVGASYVDYRKARNELDKVLAEDFS